MYVNVLQPSGAKRRLPTLAGGLTVTLSDWLTPAVGVATIAQAAFAYLALKGLRDSRIAAQAATDGLALTRDTTQRQLRAYVCYRKAVHERFEIGKVIALEVEFENCGVTPAYSVVVVGQLVIVGQNEPVEFRPPPQDVLDSGSHTTLGQSRTVTLNAWSEAPLSAQAFDDLAAGRQQLLVYGVLQYRDIFGDDRETSFRVRYNHECPAQDLRLSLCAEGNNAT